MEVLRLRGPNDVRLREEPEPIVAPGEELVRVTVVGLCGSDLRWYQHGRTDDDRLGAATVLGHEVGGVIASGPQAGERVVVEPSHPCAACTVCRAGHGNLCPEVRFLGRSPVDGGLRQLIAWPRRLLLRVPDTIAGDEVALLEPLAVTFHAIELGQLRAGMSAAVYGAGPLGQLLIRSLRASGVGPILATDVLPHRVEAARASGADDARLTRLDGQPDDVSDWGPVDVAFEVAGEEAALETALRTVRPGGRVVVVGTPPSDRHSFEASLARRKGLTISLLMRPKAHHMLRAIELVDDGAVDLSGIITERFTLSEGPAAFEALARRGGLKIVVKPSE